MNKILKIALITITILLSSITIVNAATTDELYNYITKTHIVAGKEIKISEADTVKVKRYLAEYPISGDKADQIIAKINSAITLMNQAGVSEPQKLSKAKKKELLSIAQEAATIAGATLTYDSHNKSITIYKEGKVYDVIYLGSDSSTFRATGNNNIYVYTTILVIAFATIIVYRKRKVNA